MRPVLPVPGHGTSSGAPAPELDRIPWRERIARINGTLAAQPGEG